MAEDAKATLITLTADIAAAYVEHNLIAAGDLPGLIRSIHGALSGIDAPAAPLESPLVPAVPVKKSVGDDHLVCLEDGRKFKSLKRHLRVKYGLSPDEYRAKWGLPKSYPMVAPSYTATRSALAKQMGLGHGGRQPAAAKSKTPARTRPKKG